MAKTKTAAKPRRSSKTTAKAKTSTASKSKKTTAKSTKKKAATKKTPAKRAKTKPAAEEEVKVSRRRKERRTEEVAEKQPTLERREKVNRRRQIDPTTCERDYSDQEVEFMNALDQYKRTSGRMFPTCSEILEVIREIGYVKLSPSELAARKAMEAPADDLEASVEAEATEALEESLANQEEAELDLA